MTLKEERDSALQNHPFKIGQMIEGVYTEGITEHFIVTDILIENKEALEYSVLPRIQLYRIRTQEFLCPTIERIIFSWMKDYGFIILEGT